MKIREVLDKKVGDTKYTRYIVILPKIHRKSYRAFNCGKTEFGNHQELVFITKVR